MEAYDGGPVLSAEPGDRVPFYDELLLPVQLLPAARVGPLQAKAGRLLFHALFQLDPVRDRRTGDGPSHTDGPDGAFGAVRLVQTEPRRDRNLLVRTRFKAMYLPWVLLGMNMILSSGSIFSLVGIFVGHAYYFLKFSYPSELGGPALIETPFFIKRYFPDVQGGTHGFGVPPVGQRPVQQQQQGDMAGFRHAWGVGHTLGRN